MNYQELKEAKQSFRIYTLEKEYQSLYKLRKDFVHRFTPEKIASMSIDEYVVGKQSKKSFCYILEHTLKGLGNFSGQYSTKFGVWYSSEQQEYKFEPRLGEDYKQAFKEVCTQILNLLEAGKIHDNDAIIKNRLNSLLKGKILSVYYPDNYLNIFSREHLDYYLKALDLDTAELMRQDVQYKKEALLDFISKDKDMTNWSVNMFATFLWSHYPKAPIKPTEISVEPDEEEIEFPSLDVRNISFVTDLQLAKGKQSTSKRSQSGKPSPDYEKEARKYKKLGDRGEFVVIQKEVERVMKDLNISESKAKQYVKWVSRESDTFGYDIRSVNKDKSERYIEVKATRGKVGNMDFYYTENEYETAKKYGGNYYIYIVYEILSTRPKIWMIKNPFVGGEGINMKPIKYKVELRTK